MSCLVLSLVACFVVFKCLFNCLQLFVFPFIIVWLIVDCFISWERSKHGFEAAPMWICVYAHKDDKSIFIVCVDDLMLVATCAKTFLHWRSLEKFLESKETEASIDRCLGVYHKLQAFDPKNPGATRTLSLNMCDYARSAVGEFRQSGRSL